MALIDDALFDTVDEGQKARPKKLLKRNIQTSRAYHHIELVQRGSVGFLQTPVPEILKRPPSGPIRFGLDFVGYRTEA